MKHIKHFYYFLKVIFQQRYIIRKLVSHDFQKKYLATYLGLPWAFLQPAAVIFVIWFVVSIGLRGSNLIDGVPFLPWFISGMIPWFFLREGISDGSRSLIEFSFLIKKMYFRVGIIPVIKIATALLIHLFLLAVLLILVLFYGYSIDLYWLQILYYLVCSIFLVVGISWLASSLMVFIRDVKQTVEIFLTLLFWITPIMWSANHLKGNAALLAALNPFHYIVNGYRETLIYKQWFFEDLSAMLYFWSITGVLFVGGALVFTRLKPHFADVL
jgi:lipopolysaccharide transport system permease protein/teichoic acid transport system permease protein